MQVERRLNVLEYEDGASGKIGLMSAKMMETRYYEGCGREGPIRCIFLGEFHPVAGPKISCQFPEDYISKEVFDSISAYIIPKPQIQKCTMTINALGHKIVGYPIRIENPRYERNVYLFNICFVCDSWSKTVQYEPVVKKLGEHLTIMEEETRFVSGASSKLPTLLAHLLHDLNTYRKATVVEGDTVMHLKVLEVRKDPPPVYDHDVPVLIASVGMPRPGRPRRTTPPEGSEDVQNQEHIDVEDDEPFEVDMEANWDLTTRQLLPHIDGYNHISKIAADTNVEKTLVKSCIQNLVYYGVVTLIPVLKFSNMYRATPNLSRLFSDLELQKSCLAFITKGNESAPDKPTLSEVLEVLCALQQGTTLRAVCERFSNPQELTFDIRRLIVYAQLHGLIKCLKRYPVYMRAQPRLNGFTNRVDPVLGIKRLFNGRHCTDEICCLARIDLHTLEQIIEDDPNVTIIWRALKQVLLLANNITELMLRLLTPSNGDLQKPRQVTMRTIMWQPTLSDVLEVLCALQHGTTMRAVCERFSIPPELTYELRRMVAYAQLHGLFKCITRYSVSMRVPPHLYGFTNRMEPVLAHRRMCNGHHSTQQVCCMGRVDLHVLKQIIEQNPNVTIIWR